jgi:apolipoprotein D and lipocalin family protein
MRIAALLAVLAAVPVIACAGKQGASLPPPAVVPSVDLARYAGTWYEIASYPNRFQKGCAETSAVYTPRPDGAIEVLNRCIRDGKEDTIKGTARVADSVTMAKLKVTFFRPFSGDYWIIDLGERYEYAVVSNPERTYLWVLSRTPRLEDAVYSRITAWLAGKGFDTAKLVKTRQSGP